MRYDNLLGKDKPGIEEAIVTGWKSKAKHRT